MGGGDGEAYIARVKKSRDSLNLELVGKIR